MAEKSTTEKSPLPNSGDHDRVVMASRAADGTAAQTPDYEFIGDKETSIAATKEQLAQQAVSAIDAAERPLVYGDQGSDMDPDVAELKSKHDDAADAAAKTAEAEVEARFTDDESRIVDRPSAPSSTAGSSSSSSSSSSGK